MKEKNLYFAPCTQEIMLKQRFSILAGSGTLQAGDDLDFDSENTGFFNDLS